MRLAYADPPYVGQAAKHYRHDPRCAEVDHVALFTQLQQYDGWALSASSPSILGPQGLAAMAPEGCRIASWRKPFAIFKPNVNPAYAWEPVFFKSARPNRRDIPTVRDWLETEETLFDDVAVNVTLRKGLSGAKPEHFCRWLFDLIGADPTDTFDDLFPGTFIVTRTWKQWCRERKAA